MRLSCSTACFPADRLEIAVAKIGWAGYRHVELALDAATLPPEEALRARLRADELELAAVNAGVIPAAEGDHVESLAAIGRAAALARSLDGSLLICRAPASGSLRQMAASLELLDLALGGLAVDVCLVNRRETLLDRPEALEELWAHDLSDRYAVALDPAEAHLAGWNPLALDLLPALPRHVYLNDATSVRVVPPGDGDVDLEGLGHALRLRGYSGAISLVLENADPWDVEPRVKEAYQLAAAWFGAS